MIYFEFPMCCVFLFDTQLLLSYHFWKRLGFQPKLWNQDSSYHAAEISSTAAGADSCAPKTSNSASPPWLFPLVCSTQLECWASKAIGIPPCQSHSFFLSTACLTLLLFCIFGYTRNNLFSFYLISFQHVLNEWVSVITPYRVKISKTCENCM